jgi:hypothetical protein
VSVVETLGDALANTTLEAMEHIDDERFYEKVSQVIGASSPTLQEAYLTAIRVRLAERRGRAFVAKALAAAKAGAVVPDAAKIDGAGGH